MKLLFLGDIIGEVGCRAIKEYLPSLSNKYASDIVIANAENVTNGAGISPEDFYRLKEYGVDIITLGNHYIKNAEIIPILQNQSNNILRPYNYYVDVGYGVTEYQYNQKQNLIVANIALRQYMEEEAQCPFKTIDKITERYNIDDQKIAAIFIDAHGASAFEKKALAHYCDGKVSAFIGTHTHVQTNDLAILQKGTAYLSDAGMCGAIHSCTGAEISSAINYFINDSKTSKTCLNEPAIGSQAGLSGVYIQIAENKQIIDFKQVTWWNQN